MAFHLRFRRSFPILGGLFRFNINKSSLSLTGKAGPFSRTWSTTGRRTTNIDLPGRGASLRSVTTSGRHRGRSETPPDHRGRTEQERWEDEQRAELRRRIAERRAALRRRRRNEP